MTERQSIAVETRRRGRPKGTGINDAETLARIHTLMSSDKDMKPTSAIKKLGITDPSIVRRLRDKLRSAPASPAPLKQTAAPSRQEALQETPDPKPAAPTPAPIATEPPSPVTSQPPPPTPRPAPTPPTEQAQKAREQALLAAYLQAMMQSPPSQTQTAPQTAFQPLPPEQSQLPIPRETPRPAQQSPESSLPPRPTSTPDVANPMSGFTMPFFPSFLQPFQQRPAPASAAQTALPIARQMEAMKLAVEATTAIAKMQLHIVENANAYSPLALMLQGQTFMGQMLMASLTGQMDAFTRKPPEKK